MGFFQDQPFFSRNYFTTGILLSHPAFSQEGVDLSAIARAIYDGFLLTIPFEGQDVGNASDRFRANRLPAIREGQAFVAIYDQTYGSLRLTSRLLESGILCATLVHAVHILTGKASSVTVSALAAAATAAIQSPRAVLAFQSAQAEEIAPRDPERWERIVLPGSKGLMARTSEEFMVKRILNTPAGLSYEGTPAAMMGTAISYMPLLSDVVEIPGESKVGWYDIHTEAIEPIYAEDHLETQVVETQAAMLDRSAQAAALAEIAANVARSEQIAHEKMEQDETII
jgi:DEAD/DEAH box helicase domain-containing protein